MQRQTIVVEGLLAYRMQRAAAARANAIGREILMLPQLAARLDGSFVEAAPPEVLYPLIRAALADGGFAKFAGVTDLPGTPRAVMETLRKVWNADLDLGELRQQDEHLADLHLIENRIRRDLPVAWLLPADLRDRAIEKAHRAPRLLGSIVLEGVVDVAPLWRPLVTALAQQVPTEWRATGPVNRSWFKGQLVERALSSPALEQVESAADVRSEVVEALRWVREQLSSGSAVAADIAIAATSPSDYDEHLLVLRQESGLPIHFSRGVPALSTAAGQSCAALADVLLRGLSQDSIRRLLHGLPRRNVLKLLPSDWAKGLRSAAILNTVGQWEVAFARSRNQRADGDLAERVLLPVLRQLAFGTGEALELGQLLLGANAFAIWKDALRAAPAEALAMSLQQLRVADDTDAANSVAWCSAEQLAASPRPVVRLLGLSVKSWPRNGGDDPLLPDQVVPRRTLQPRSLTDIDRTSFVIIRGHARQLALSRSRRSARGGMQAASPLWPKQDEIELARLRVPSHAYSETDRLLARPTDALAEPRVSRSRTCWRASYSNQVTAHDGLVARDHPVILRALGEPMSATTLRLLLRDPQAFVWVRGLDWRPKEFSRKPLTLDPAAFGELVHELISMSVRKLDSMGGVQRTSNDEREQVVADVAAAIQRAWPTERAVPPPALWASTLEKARGLTLHALKVDEDLPHSLNSWTELGFGGGENGEGAPWPDGAEVHLQDTTIRVVGRIDRLDLAKSGSAARITDYKTSKPPSNPDDIVLNGGKDLQRVLYATAVKQLVPDVGRVVARLLYLGNTIEVKPLEGEQLDRAMTDLSRFVIAAAETLRAGQALPGPDAFDSFSRYRIARPADWQLYQSIKARAFAAANAPLEEGRSCP